MTSLTTGISSPSPYAPLQEVSVEEISTQEDNGPSLPSSVNVHSTSSRSLVGRSLHIAVSPFLLPYSICCRRGQEVLIENNDIELEEANSSDETESTNDSSSSNSSSITDLEETSKQDLVVEIKKLELDEKIMTAFQLAIEHSEKKTQALEEKNQQQEEEIQALQKNIKKLLKDSDELGPKKFPSKIKVIIASSIIGAGAFSSSFFFGDLVLATLFAKSFGTNMKAISRRVGRKPRYVILAILTVMAYFIDRMIGKKNYICITLVGATFITVLERTLKLWMIGKPGKDK